ncbi:MAG: MarR family transcriptional regulator [Actinomycetaceae bacterium]|nr:MarR family transcriptional regulator [Actinomycetaceae bacterium]
MTSGHSDEVDKIVSAWREQRPDLDSRPMLIFSRVSRLARHLDLSRRTAFMENGLDTWEFDVLSVLRRAGKPYVMTPGALMTELLVSSGTMTNRIDRLEAKNLVKRVPSPTDRRAVLVTLTKEGQTRVDAALETLLAEEEQLLAGFGEDDRARLAELLRPLLLNFEAND